MVCWIVIFPSSWLMGHSKDHDIWVNRTLVEPYDGTQFSPRVVTKYEGHPEVQFSHILPAAIWSAAIPFQLHQGFRKNYKAAHRTTGYAFLFSSLLMTAGIFIIVAKKLTYESDYEGWAPPVKPLEERMAKALIMGLGLWFGYTAIMSINEARKKRFQSHKHYIYRHIGSGLWVAVQRVLVIGFGPRPNAEAMRNFFGNAAYSGVAITLCLAELAVYLDRQPKRQIKMQ